MKKTKAYLGEQCSQPREQKMQRTRREQMSCRVTDYRDVTSANQVNLVEIEKTLDFIVCAGKSLDGFE